MVVQLYIIIIHHINISIILDSLFERHRSKSNVNKIEFRFFLNKTYVAYMILMSKVQYFLEIGLIQNLFQKVLFINAFLHLDLDVFVFNIRANYI